jgi:hypothetical protein
MNTLTDFQRRATRGTLFNGLTIASVFIWGQFLGFSAGENTSSVIYAVIPPIILAMLVYLIPYAYFKLAKKYDAVNAIYQGKIPKRMWSNKERFYSFLILIFFIFIPTGTYMFLYVNTGYIFSNVIFYVTLPSMAFALFIMDLLDINCVID